MPTATRQNRAATPPEGRGARDVYLGSGLVSAGVRDLVGESWVRSSQAGLDASVLAPSHSETAADPKVLAAVDAVLARQVERLSGEQISIIFALPSGLILRQVCPDRSLSRRLGKVSLEPGFDYGEGAVGTNGIGTALRAEKPTLIVGSEHFADELTVFACAGSPVRHPVSRSLVGIVDLTCSAERGNNLLLAYARTIAEEIEMELLQTVGAKQLALLRDYLAACRHATGPIVALNADVVMMNHHAQQSLTSPDRVALLARTSDLRTEEQPTTLVADLPSGIVARMDYRPTFCGPDLAGGIFRIGLREGVSTLTQAPEAPRLPGLAGTSPSWLRTVGALRHALRSRQWAVLDGEHGVGKFALAQAMHYAEGPERHFRMLDATTAAADPDAWLAVVQEEFAGPPGTLVIRHLSLIPAPLVGPLSELLIEESAKSRAGEGHWVVATRDSETNDDSGDIMSKLVPTFDVTITLEPLRHRADDVRVMAQVMLRQISRSPDVTLSPRALNQLQRNPWPGNAVQLHEVLRKALTSKRRGVIELTDLPSECLAVGRRTLTTLESLERDAIAQALRTHRGNKSLAAANLGMSRATIYRKIREYSITTDS